METIMAQVHQIPPQPGKNTDKPQVNPSPDKKIPEDVTAHAKVPENTEEQGQTGNIKQNIVNQGRQQDR
jgi:hypothetical protein